MVDREVIKDGRTDGWQSRPTKPAQKDRDARGTVKYAKAKPHEDGSLPTVDLAIPASGYKNHIAIGQTHGLSRTWAETNAAAHESAQLEEVLDRGNTASDVWADNAHRSSPEPSVLPGSE